MRRLQALSDRWTFPPERASQMHVRQFGHELMPQDRPTVLKKPRSDTRLLRCRRVPPRPGAELGEHRNEGDGLLRQAVDGLLLVAGVIGLGDHSLVQEHLQPIG